MIRAAQAIPRKLLRRLHPAPTAPVPRNHRVRGRIPVGASRPARLGPAAPLQLGRTRLAMPRLPRRTRTSIVRSRAFAVAASRVSRRTGRAEVSKIDQQSAGTRRRFSSELAKDGRAKALWVQKRIIQEDGHVA